MTVHFTHPQHIDDSHPEREGDEYREPLKPQNPFKPGTYQHDEWAERNTPIKELTWGVPGTNGDE